MFDLGVNDSLAIMAITFPATCIFTIECVTSSVPAIDSGFVPLDKPVLNSGPTSIHPEPVNKYSC